MKIQLALVALVLGVGLSGCAYLPARCTVGVVGTNASMTIDGIGAATACDAVIQNQKTAAQPTPASGTVVVPSPPVQFYRASQEPTAVPLVCEYTIRGLTYRVRDQGVFILAGGMLCNEVQRAIATATH